MLILPDRPLPSSQLVFLVFSAFRVTFLPWLRWLIPMAILASVSYFYSAAGSAVEPVMQLVYPLFLLFSSFWFLLAMLCQGRSILAHKPLNPSEIIQFTQAHYLRFAAASFITLIILSLLSILILPYCFVFPIILFAPMGVIFQNYSIFASFKYAWQLVWGNWWHTFIVFLLTFIMPLLIIALLVLSLSRFFHSALFIYFAAGGKLLALLIGLPLAVNTLLILYNDLWLRYKAQPLNKNTKSILKAF